MTVLLGVRLDWIKVPKAELHVHLEGSMKHERVLALARNKEKHPWHGFTADDLNSQLQTQGFEAFLQNYKNGLRLLSSSSDYQALTEDLCAEFVSQGVQAADVLYSPGPSTQILGVPLASIHSGIECGLKQFPKLRIRFVLDTVLNLGPDFMNKTLDAVLKDRPDFVKGFSVGGGIPDLNLNPFLFLFEKAQKSGLFCVAHCGEVDPAANIEKLIRETDVIRIAHAVRAPESQSVLKILKKRQIPIDVSLTSNLRTGVVASLDQHPLRTFQEWGIPFTINTDDPFYFQTNLINEYHVAAKLIGEAAILEAAERSCFLGNETRNRK